MAAAIVVRITAEPFDAADETSALQAVAGDAGAIATFTGLCRSEEGALTALELEHYPGMAERQIEAHAREAASRFGLLGVRVVHRHGRMVPGDGIVFVACASRHRQAAFDGANYIMDFLKTDAPFWKKEHRRDGSTGWVEAKDKDDRARDRWLMPGDRPSAKG